MTDPLLQTIPHAGLDMLTVGDSGAMLEVADFAALCFFVLFGEMTCLQWRIFIIYLAWSKTGHVPD